jgi:hypothetical protein
VTAIGIILIVVAVLAVLAILYFAVFSPKKRAEKRLIAERERAAERHREVASERHSRASIAEQKAEEAKVQAQRAEQEAELARNEATVHEGRADLHDQGLADHELESSEASANGHRSENIDRAGPDETTTPMDRPANLADRDESRLARDEQQAEDGERRDAPAQRW